VRSSQLYLDALSGRSANFAHNGGKLYLVMLLFHGKGSSSSSGEFPNMALAVYVLRWQQRDKA
jgi:hypothetical protein